MSNTMRSIRYSDWPKRYCAWRVERCGLDGYETFFDTFAEAVEFRNSHLSEDVEVEDNYGDADRDAGGIAVGIWYWCAGQLA